MTETMILKLVFGIFLSIGGIVLILLAYALGYKYLIQEKRCTCLTKGRVRRYTISRRGNVHLPIVYYRVDGLEYHVTGPEYKAYITVTKRGPAAGNTVEYQEKNQVFKVSRTLNSFAGVYANPMEELYPLGSEVNVYYDPAKPKLAYVERYCNNKWLFWLMFLTGVGILVIGGLIQILL